MKNLKYILAFSCLMFSCTSKFLKYDKEAELAKNTEFENQVQIKELPQEAAVNVATPNLEPKQEVKPVLDKKIKSKTAKKVIGKTLLLPEPLMAQTRQPSLEDKEGFGTSRRPLNDPFKVGEKVIHSVSYFGAEAGKLTFAVKPFVEVNGKKSYNFVVDIKSSSLFSNFYSVDDQVETYVDYEELVPYVFKLKIKESGQLKEARSYFDQQTLKANYWEKKYTEKNGHEEKKLAWDLMPYSQNAFSAVFYMRFFKWNVGQEYAFRVSDDEKNVIFKGKAIEKVKLNTNAGAFDAIKIKAEITSRGALSQTGDLYLWVSDDEHKYMLRFEAKIKIGTIVSEVEKIVP